MGVIDSNRCVSIEKDKYKHNSINNAHITRGGTNMKSLLVCFGLICFSLTIGVVLVEGRVGSDSSRSLEEESTTYKRRGLPLDDASQSKLEKKWGAWSFVDSARDSRPTETVYHKFANRDVPKDKFPTNAWQTDTTYLEGFLTESKALLMRSMEAILSEYGFGMFDANVKGQSFEERSQLFDTTFIDLDDDGNAVLPKELPGATTTTRRSFDGLVRRILHAIMTEDTFTVVMGGHSAAAGHGNNFQQSYTLQVQRVIEPIFARLGVKSVARNFGMGGLGTMHNAMGAGSIYGQDIDYLIWDSGMTEGSPAAVDLFFRQSILGSTSRVPYISGPEKGTSALINLHNNADVDFGLFKIIPLNILETKDEMQVLTLPWAARYIKCSNDMKHACDEKKNRFKANCWIDRDDFEPPTKQKDIPGGQAGWHPGNRAHQINGRVIAFNILNAAYTGINQWIEAQDKQLADEAWHVKDYYKNIRTKLASMNSSNARCYEVDVPDEFCNVPFKSRTEFTPRANPQETSLRTIMELPKVDGEVSQWLLPKQNVYDGPDVSNPMIEPPIDAINYLHIVQSGVDYVPLLSPKTSPFFDSEVGKTRVAPIRHKDITPGLGWELKAQASPDKCDGTYDSFCGRNEDKNCLLYAHNDGRNGLVFDSLSGWGIFTLKGLLHGVITLKIETWHKPAEVHATIAWETANNGELASRNRNLKYDIAGTEERNKMHRNQNRHDHRRTKTQMATNCQLIETRRLEENVRNNNTTDIVATQNERKLGGKSPPICDDWHFEYSINGGEIKSLDAFEFCDTMTKPERVVQLITLLHDPEYTNGKNIDVEVAIRMVGCGNENVVFSLTHIYWA